MRMLTLGCVLSLVAVLQTLQAATDADKPDEASLTRAGKAAAERIATDGAAWTVEFEIPNAGTVTLDVIRTATAAKWTFRTRVDGRSMELARIIEQNAVWHVWERGKPLGKYRPYEAPISVLPAYVFLAGSMPAFITGVDPLKNAKYMGREGDIVEYYFPIAAAQRKKLEACLKEAQAQLVPASRPEASQLEQRLNEMKAKIEQLRVVKVDVRSGMLVQDSSGGLVRRIKAFRWLEKVDPDEFKVDQNPWKERLDDPTSDSNLDDLVMVDYSPIWEPNSREAPPTTTLLMNLKTGAYRRVPFEGAGSMTGCFLKSRRKVVVVGLGDNVMPMRLYEVDLSSGKNRPLGNDTITEDVVMGPTLSPDGKTLAAMGMTMGLPVRMQLYLIDVETNHTRKVGTAFDGAFLSWLPDNKGFVLVTRRPNEAGLDMPEKRLITRMDLDGKLTILREGDCPLLLRDGRILFEDEAGLWNTCDLEGKSVKLFGAGFKGHGFPTLSPDGKSILWIKTQWPKPVVPMITDIETGTSRRASELSGYWMEPCWR